MSNLENGASSRSASSSDCTKNPRINAEEYYSDTPYSFECLLVNVKCFGKIRLPRINTVTGRSLLTAAIRSRLG